MKNLDLTNINFMTGIDSSYFTHCKQEQADCFTHSLFNSGDYSGSAVQVSNRKVMLENKELCERLNIIALHEHYSTDSLLFPISALNDSELIEIFKALERYPCLDEQGLSEVERELETECFDSFGLQDFKSHLVKKTEFDIESLDDEQVKNIYYECSSLTNYNVFEVESGTSGHFDFDCFGGLYDKQVEIFNTALENMNITRRSDLETA